MVCLLVCLLICFRLTCSHACMHAHTYIRLYLLCIPTGCPHRMNEDLPTIETLQLHTPRRKQNLKPRMKHHEATSTQLAIQPFAPEKLLLGPGGGGHVQLPERILWNAPGSDSDTIEWGAQQREVRVRRTLLFGDRQPDLSFTHKEACHHMVQAPIHGNIGFQACKKKAHQDRKCFVYMYMAPRHVP